MTKFNLKPSHNLLRKSDSKAPYTMKVSLNLCKIKELKGKMKKNVFKTKIGIILLSIIILMSFSNMNNAYGAKETLPHTGYKKTKSYNYYIYKGKAYVYYIGKNKNIKIPSLFEGKPVVQASIELGSPRTIDTSNCKELKSLYISSTKIKKLDLNKNKKLIKLSCNYNNKLIKLSASENKFKTVDLKNNKKLEYINLADNKIKSVNLREHKKLKYVNVNENMIKRIDITNSKNLETFYCYNNPIKEIDLSGAMNMKRLDIENTNVTTLDVSHMKHLQRLSCDRLGLNELDVTKNKKLSVLYCSNNTISKLDLSKNKKLNIVDFSSNPGLEIKIASKNLEFMWYSPNEKRKLVKYPKLNKIYKNK